jgi:hypothetical protein
MYANIRIQDRSTWCYRCIEKSRFSCSRTLWTLLNWELSGGWGISCQACIEKSKTVVAILDYFCCLVLVIKNVQTVLTNEFIRRNKEFHCHSSTYVKKLVSGKIIRPRRPQLTILGYIIFYK